MSDTEEKTEDLGNEMMSDLAAAWDAAEDTSDGDDTGTENSVLEPEGEPDSGAGLTTGDSGTDGVEDSTDQDAVQPDNVNTGAVDQVAEEGEKPPVSLSAAAREVWKDTPEALRKEVTKREQDYAKGIQRYAESAKRAEAMDRTLQPYQQLFAMNGGAAQTMPGLLQTASVLQMGNPQQKAQQVAAIIQQFGIDIGTLDNLLIGEAPSQEVQNQTAIQQAVQQAVMPYQQFANQQAQQQQYAAQQAHNEVANEVQQFAQSNANEFYNDVKAEMADILDLAANRGREMGMQEAYDQACQLNPQIRQIVQGRQSQQSVDSKRKAGSSIHGTLGGDGGSSAPDSTRAAIEMAWESTGRA